MDIIEESRTNTWKRRVSIKDTVKADNTERSNEIEEIRMKQVMMRMQKDEQP